MAEERLDATPFPQRRSLTALRDAAAGCRGRNLWRPARQTVFGEGRQAQRDMLVEDLRVAAQALARAR